MLEREQAEGHRLEEVANALTHGLGLALSVAGLAILVVVASLHGDPWQVVSCSIYGTTLVLLYGASTLYHSARSPRLKHVLRVVDHSSIYLLIAGTYTPFMLVTLRGGWGWSLFGVVWGLAVAGIVFKAFFVGRWDGLSTLVYLLMGWLAVIAAKPILAAMTPAGIVLLTAGGLAYSLGVIFYQWEKVPYSHAIWHLFVLAGSVCHFFSVLVSAVPAKA